MEKTRLRLIALSALCLLLVMTLDPLMILKKAEAISASDFTFGAVNTEVFYQESIDTYAILQKSPSAQDSANLCFLSGNADNPATDQVCFNIFPQKDGCDVSTVDPVNYNPCSATTGTTDCDTDFPDSLPCSDKTGLTGVFEGLWCGSTYCYIMFDYDTGSWSSQLIRIWSLGVGSAQTGDISGYRNITNTFDLQPAIWGFDECNPAPPNCGIGGITLYWSYQVGGGNTWINKEGGTSLMGTTNNVDTVINTVSGSIKNIDGCRHCGGVSTNTRVFISTGHNTGASREAVLYNGATMAEIGSYSPNVINTACSGSGVGGSATNTGLSQYMGDTVNRFAYVTDTGIAFIGSNTGSLVVGDCQPDVDLSMIDYARGISIDEDNNLWYMWHGSTQSLATITQFNLTYASIDVEVDFAPDDITIDSSISSWVDGGQPYNSMAVDYDVKTILMTSDSAKARLLYLDDFEVPTTGGGGSTNGTCNNVDTNGDGISGTVLDCVGTGTSPFSGITGGRNVTDITATLTDDIGLTNCGDNPDHETCGSGLFLFLFLLLLTEFLALGGYLGFTAKTNSEVRLMDIGLLVLIIGFVDLAIGFYLNWIPDIVFYSIVAIVAGFLAFGLFSRFRGG